MTKIEEMASRIIKEQELIIGPIAWSEAQKVEGLQIDSEATGEIAIESTDPKTVINGLVARYERLFGRASRESSREAVASLLADLPQSDIPSSLLAA